MPFIYCNDLIGVAIKFDIHSDISSTRNRWQRDTFTYLLLVTLMPLVSRFYAPWFIYSSTSRDHTYTSTVESHNGTHPLPFSIDSRLLDLLLTNEELMVQQGIYYLSLGRSDHAFLAFHFACYASSSNKPQPSFRAISDYGKFRNLCLVSDWIFLSYDDLASAWSRFPYKLQAMVQASTEYRPSKTNAQVCRSIRSRTRKWLTQRNSAWH